MDTDKYNIKRQKDMGVMKTLCDWASAKHRQSKERKKQEREAELASESMRVLQVREFGGELFVCYNDEPIVPTEVLKWDIPTALDRARAAYKEYRRTRGLWNRK